VNRISRVIEWADRKIVYKTGNYQSAIKKRSKIIPLSPEPEVSNFGVGELGIKGERRS